MTKPKAKAASKTTAIKTSTTEARTPEFPYLPKRPEIDKVYNTAKGLCVKCVTRPASNCEDCVFAGEYGCTIKKDHSVETCCDRISNSDHTPIKFIRVSPEEQNKLASALAEKPAPAVEKAETPPAAETAETSVHKPTQASKAAAESAGNAGHGVSTSACASGEKAAAVEQGDDKEAAALACDPVIRGYVKPASATVTIADVMAKIRLQQYRLARLGYSHDNCSAVQMLAEARLSLGDMLADAVLKDGKGGAE